MECANLINQREIPNFDDFGNLPEGVYEVSMKQIEENFTWTQKRKDLFSGLSRAVANLCAAGVKFIYIDGSFATAKDEPNDIDGCWVPNKDIREDVIDKVFVDRSPPRKRMFEKYGVDFLIAGLDFGDKGKPIEDFFQEDRSGGRKGILLLNL